MKINIFLLILIIFLVCIGLAVVYEPLRYMRYLLPLVPFLFYSRKQPPVIDGGIGGYYISFLWFYASLFGYLFVQNALFSSVSSRFIPNAAFVLLPLAFIVLIIPFFRKERVPEYIKTIYFVSIGIFFVEETYKLFSKGVSLSAFKDAFVSSKILTESHLGFIFGFLAVYFFIEKYGKVYWLTALLLVILCFKRIVIGAVFACMISHFLISLFRIDISKQRVAWTVAGLSLNLAFVWVAHLVVMGVFDVVVYKSLGISADFLLMGRKTFFTEAFDKVGLISWFGEGLGKMDVLIEELYGAKMNLHSEILKNYFEFGFFLFIAWLIVFFHRNLFSNKSFIFLMYLNILMLTDNVFIYFDTMFYFYFFMLIFLHELPRGVNESVNDLRATN